MPIALLVPMLPVLAVAGLATQIPGDTVRVRIGLGPDQVQGVVSRLDGRVLELVPLDRAAVRIVPLEQVTELERRDGLRRRPMTGAALGYLVGTVVMQVAVDNTGYSRHSKQTVQIGALAGIGAGLIVGHLVRTPRWRRTSLVTVRPDLLPGQLVRGAGAGPSRMPFQGVIARATPDSLYVVGQGGPAVAVSRHDLTGLEWPVARRRAIGYGIGLGALAGGLAGAALGYASYNEDDWFFDSAGATALFVGIAGAVFGMTVGGIVGALHHRTVWESAPRVEQPAVAAQIAPILAPDRVGAALRVSW